MAQGPGKINLKAYSFRAPQPDFRSGEILRRAKWDAQQKQVARVDGLVTQGWVEAQQGTGGYGWAITERIDFPYAYFGMPIFTFGMAGSYSGINHDADGIPQDNVYASTGGNDYSGTLPPPLQTFIDDADVTTFQPALFIPRVIHWVLANDLYFVGCFLLICQVNPNCTEINKVTRLFYRFEGTGTRR